MRKTASRATGRTSPRGSRRPLTKAQLLPLPTAEVQRLSLKFHLALATLRAGHVDAAACAALLNALYLAFLLRDARDPDLTRYQTADAVLNAVMARAEAGRPSTLTDPERAALERLVVHLDGQLAEAPLHRFVDAWAQLERITHHDGHSPIPVAG
ncbi:hypothetical protein CFB82_40770 [Burkholderia sp. HI2714]|uniref:hypothetical protein n=1 Tax=Burkholderia sp. HI2714 TaxID=2015359 RepID=UPI000B7A390D|nr:hypothetical protein [Burkholderia sp. HI2714]OXJ22459.1 hypothetical protein CFB82_40770 [Burkholderia sp. HI2714]